MLFVGHCYGAREWGAHLANFGICLSQLDNVVQSAKLGVQLSNGEHAPSHFHYWVKCQLQHVYHDESLAAASGALCACIVTVSSLLGCP